MGKHRFARRIALSVSVAALLSACTTSTNPNAAAAANNTSGPTTTLGTRNSVSQSNPAITDNANATWTEYAPQPEYPRVLRKSLQFITLTAGANAGKKLGVLVSVPADDTGAPATGTFPAILTQTAYRIDLGAATSLLLPFGTSLAIGGTDDMMIKHGYVTVAVDILGSGVSDGDEHLLDDAEQEAYGEAVDWITQQPWSNGKVGVAGTSYLGISALFTAEQHRSAVKAAFVQVPMGDAWRDVIGTGGMLNGVFIANWLPLTQGLSVQNQHAIDTRPISRCRPSSSAAPQISSSVASRSCTNSSSAMSPPNW
jgi:hypothetical protein